MVHSLPRATLLLWEEPEGRSHLLEPPGEKPRENSGENPAETPKQTKTAPKIPAP